MIEANTVTKKFDDFTALNGISLKVSEGTVCGMVGSNGAGKSTLMRLFAGIYRADSGATLLDGEKTYENPKAKSRVVFVPDELYFPYGASLKRMARLYKRIHPGFDRQRLFELTGEFGLDAKKSINTFSKGMKRQAAILLALACRPDYYLFDETFDGLDPIMRGQVKNLIMEETAQRGATAVITSHSLRELQDISEQLALIHQGGLVLESDVTTLSSSHFKVQIAFSDEYDKSRFDKIKVVHFSKFGSVSNLVVEGDIGEATAFLKSMEPTVLEVLPLSLEEVFTYEMEALGYTQNRKGAEQK